MQFHDIILLVEKLWNLGDLIKIIAVLNNFNFIIFFED